MPGTAATGGVLRPVAAMLGPGTWSASIQASTGTARDPSGRPLGQVSQGCRLSGAKEG